MIDIHSHIINGIDDGSKTIEESISLLKQMKKLGINVIVATPHYITGTSYTSDNYSKKCRLAKIKEILENGDIGLDLYLGNEVFIDHDIDKLVKDNEIATINGSKYILIEFPRNSKVLDLTDILFNLRSKGYVPIIAHPERYVFLQEDYKVINEFLEMGCLFQGNLENAVSKYGKNPEKVFWYMLKNNKYQFLATDIHHDTDPLFKNYSKIQSSIVKFVGEEKFYTLTHINPMKVLKNEMINIGEISPIIKKFGKWK